MIDVRKFSAVCMLTMLCAQTAYADVPRYDPVGYCNGLFPESTSMANFCLAQEQEEYDLLKREWSAYSKKSRAHCSNLFDDSYKMLRFCIMKEVEAEGSRQNFKF